MKATEIIRNLLDIIDNIDSSQSSDGIEADVTITAQGDDINRFKQIVDLANQEPSGDLANSPNVQVADVTAVTTAAGGGINGPKHPRDLRGNSFPIYPEGL